MLNTVDLKEPRLRVKTLALSDTLGMTIAPKHLTVRRAGVSGTLTGYVPGHGGDVWWVKHDDSEDVGAYTITELEPLKNRAVETITCQRCNGTGQEQGDEGATNCRTCNGAGQFDYALIAEYSRQIDQYSALARKRAMVIRTALKRLQNQYFAYALNAAVPTSGGQALLIRQTIEEAITDLEHAQ